MGYRKFDYSAFLCLIIVLIAATTTVQCVERHRNVTVTYNDGCNIPECEGEVNGTYNNLVHFRAVGTEDTLHYVWSTIGAPSLLMVRTGPKALLKVDWEKAVAMKDKAISFEPADDVYSMFAYVISRLIEYDDPKDTGDISKVNVTNSIDLHQLNWDNITLNETSNMANFSIMKSNFPAAENGTLSLVVTVPGVEGRGDELPHLQNLPNTTEFSLVLDNIEQTFNHSRFVVEVLIAQNRSGSVSNKDSFKLEVIPSIDDEYTPSVFQTYQLILQNTSSLNKKNFMQWKPVVYRSPTRTTDDSKPARVFNKNLTDHKHYIPLYSMVHAYDWNVSQLFLGSFNNSFGISGDDFYNATRYYAWSSTTGYGDPPKEALSILIISIISVGLGIPVILIIFGGIFVACKKRITRMREESMSKYTSINS